MKLPNDYEAAATFGGSSKRIHEGGYVCKIIEAKENTQYGCIELSIDIAEGEYKDYYGERYAASIAMGNANPYYGGIYRCYTTKRDGSTNPIFKALITCIEDSNDVKLTINGELLLDTMPGLYIGMLFGNCPYVAQNNETRKYEKRDMIKPVIPVTVERIHSGSFTNPKPRELSDRDKALLGMTEQPQTKPEDDDLPF